MVILQQGLYMDNEKIVLSLGSNVEPKFENIKNALQYLRANGVIIEKISSAYKTSPVDYEDQPEFLNIALTGMTFLSPFKLMKIIKLIEDKVGRKETFAKGPREIDIDIIFYGDVTMSTYSLEIPHTSYKNRSFVLHPIAEIIPDFIPPMENQTVTILNTLCKDEISQPKKINTFVENY